VSVRVLCQCGTSYELKDEFAGRLVKCPQCGRENRAPGTAAAVATAPQADRAFERDVFLLRQQMLGRRSCTWSAPRTCCGTSAPSSPD